MNPMKQYRGVPRRGDVLALLAAHQPASLEPGSLRSAADMAAAAAASSRAPAGIRPAGARGAVRRRPARGVTKRTLTTAGLALVAAGTAVTVLISLAGAGPRAVPRVPGAPRAHAGQVQPATASKILLTAAAHVTSGPVSGRYWRITEISGLTFPAGSKADPYDISLATTFDQWNPSSAGAREWTISKQLGARAATAADAAAWRAAGSPDSWHSGEPSYQSNASLAGYPLDWYGQLAASTAPSARTATWQVSDGTVGYIEGDEHGLDAEQFRHLPGAPSRLRAVLRHYAQQTFCGKRHVAGCSTVDQIVWAEALALLQDPVSAAVRSATFRVMAALPGVRLLGEMTDPLGRRGYAVAPGSEAPHYGQFNPTKVVLIDPGSGSLLATEDIGPMPRTLACLSFDAADLNPQSRALAGTPVRPGERLPKPHDVITKCTGSRYDGRTYPGQVDDYVALVNAGWTNASPVLPPRSARQGPSGFPGLPPAP